MLVRINSHRARFKLESALGRLPRGLFSWDFPGEFRLITRREYQLAKEIAGISRARVDRSKIRFYINW